MFSGLQASIALHGTHGSMAGSRNADEAALLNTVSSNSTNGGANAISTVDQVLKKLAMLAEAVKLKQEAKGDLSTSASQDITAALYEASTGADAAAERARFALSNPSFYIPPKAHVGDPMTPLLTSRLAGVVGEGVIQGMHARLNTVGLQHFPGHAPRRAGATGGVPSGVASRASLSTQPSGSVSPHHTAANVPALALGPGGRTPASAVIISQSMDSLISALNQRHEEGRDPAPMPPATGLLADSGGGSRAMRRRLSQEELSNLQSQFTSMKPGGSEVDMPLSRETVLQGPDGAVIRVAGFDHNIEDSEVAQIAVELGEEGVSPEVRTLQARLNIIVGKGITYSDIRALYEDPTGEVPPALRIPPGPRPISTYTRDMPVGLAGLRDLEALVPPPATITTLPSWLRNRNDFRFVEAEGKKLGTASVQGQGFGQGALVLVKRALETPGPTRGAKDIEVISAWLKNLEQFQHLGPVQLAVVARSLVVEQLSAGSKMTPTAESVYVVLTGWLHIMRTDGSGEIVGPGQSLGPRSWWSVMSSALEGRTNKLGRRLSLIVAEARDEAKSDARGLTGYKASSPRPTSRERGMPRRSASPHRPGSSGTHGGGSNSPFRHTSVPATMSTADLLKFALGGDDSGSEEEGNCSEEQDEPEGEVVDVPDGDASSHHFASGTVGTSEDRESVEHVGQVPRQVHQRSRASLASGVSGSASGTFLAPDMSADSLWASTGDVNPVAGQHDASTGTINSAPSANGQGRRKSSVGKGLQRRWPGASTIAELPDCDDAADSELNYGAPDGLDTEPGANIFASDSMLPVPVLVAEQVPERPTSPPRHTSSRDSSLMGGTGLMKARRGRRMSIFDASCIGRALAPADVGHAALHAAAIVNIVGNGGSSATTGAPSTSHNALADESLASLAGLSKVVKARLQGLTPQDLDRLGTLSPEEVMDGVMLVRLGLAEYHDTLTRYRRMVNAETARYLQENIPDFRLWGSTRLSAVARAFERRSYQNHHAIFRQGDLVDSLCLVQSGSVHIYRRADMVQNDTFPTGAASWRRQTQVKPVLVHVARIDAGGWFGFEALNWYTVLSSLDAEMRTLQAEEGGQTSRKPLPGSTVTAALKHMDVMDISKVMLEAKNVSRKMSSVSGLTAAMGAGGGGTPQARGRRPSILSALTLLRRNSSGGPDESPLVPPPADTNSEPRSSSLPPPVSPLALPRSDSSTGPGSERPVSRSSTVRRRGSVLGLPASLLESPTAGRGLRSSSAVDGSALPLHRSSVSSTFGGGAGTVASLDPEAAGSTATSKRMYEALQRKATGARSDLEPPRREVSVITDGPCVILHLRPEHFQLLHHKGLFASLQDRADVLNSKLKDQMLLDTRNNKMQLEQALKILREEAYGPRYTRSIQQGVVLIPETEPQAPMRASSMGIYEEGVLIESTKKAIKLASQLGVTLPYVADDIAALPSRVAVSLHAANLLSKGRAASGAGGGEGGEEEEPPLEWFERLRRVEKFTAQAEAAKAKLYSRAGEKARTAASGFGSRLSRLAERRDDPTQHADSPPKDHLELRTFGSFMIGAGTPGQTATSGTERVVLTAGENNVFARRNAHAGQPLPLPGASHADSSAGWQGRSSGAASKLSASLTAGASRGDVRTASSTSPRGHKASGTTSGGGVPVDVDGRTDVLHDGTGTPLHARVRIPFVSSHGARFQPLPTAGLRNIKVPLSVYGPLAHSKVSQTLPLSLDPNHPRVLTRLPILPDVHKPPSPSNILSKPPPHQAARPGYTRRGSLSSLLNPPVVLSQFSITSEAIDSMEDRMAAIYADAALIEAQANTASTAGTRSGSAASGAGGGEHHESDTAIKFRHLTALRQARELQAADGAGLGAGTAGATGAISSASAGANAVDAEVLRYQSPLEKAHRSIAALRSRGAANVLGDVVSRTYHTSVGQPFSMLPSFWPQGLVRVSRVADGDSDDEAGDYGPTWSSANNQPIPPTMATARSGRQSNAGGVRERSASRVATIDTLARTGRGSAHSSQKRSRSRTSTVALP